ncbi:hypothetical protein DEDE109153_14515 [Deinococcus deserti]|uniref:YbjN domain-containing protein n=1 Tax=Deinococcus deserti (strain DSM 17065 / CIP 109153 / LMG 22923 / VCD115) TaxID=546414 RepID=C1CY54_DEIDV|nr:hypothetical protein [Deinococcus deserti]ACO47010.2 conserved hypothetical protein, precursor [Deinococcus deserti VCD115]
MRRTLLLGATLGLTCLPHAVAGGAGGNPAGRPLLAATPGAVAASLQRAGYRVILNPEKPGRDPGMTVMAGPRELDLWLSGCVQGVCLRVTASASWDYHKRLGALNPGLVNSWNSNYYTQAYIYRNRYFLDSSQMLRGGFTDTALQTWMSEYLADLQEFEQQLP